MESSDLYINNEYMNLKFKSKATKVTLTREWHNIVCRVASRRAQKFRPSFTYLKCLNDYFEENR